MQEGLLLQTGAAAERKADAQRAAAAVVDPHATGSLAAVATAGGPRSLKRRWEELAEGGESAAEDEPPPGAMNGTAAVPNGLLANGLHDDGGEEQEADEGPTLGDQLTAMGILPSEVSLAW